jgi:hypothetical protein
MTAQNYTPDRYSETIATIERRVTETAIAAAPVLGLLPAAIITAVHCDLYLHFGPFWSPFVGAGVEAVSIAIVATRVLLPGLNMAHRERDMDRAFIGYIVAVATVNLGLNIFHGFTVDWSPDLAGVVLAELALGLLAIPVAWLVATRHEIATLQAAKERAEAKSAADNATQDAKDAQIRAEANAQELAVIAANSEAAATLKRIEADAAAVKRKERAAKVAIAKEAPVVAATVPLTPAVAEKEPCKNGCGFLVKGWRGQNAHNDTCPNNPKKAAAEAANHAN